MQIFACSRCANTVYFESRSCEACGWKLGYRPSTGAMEASASDERIAGSSLRFCANAEAGSCNWLVEPGSGGNYCRACRHNGVVPDLSRPENLRNWRRIEEAKRRLIYSLLRWRLPLPSRAEDPERGLVFAFLADPVSGGPPVMTGHDEGLVTIALAEADDAERERRRAAMNEPYRSLLGHFRHEIGHFYWNLLVRDDGRLAECRAVFGDDRQDYGEALKRHHSAGPPPDWRDGFVSAYATTHPWEDFAETWAHCMHIVDTLETASAFGVKVEGGAASRREASFDPYAESSFDRIVAAWHPVVLAVNAINRSMGAADLYPFVLSPAVSAKLSFVHGLIRHAGA